MLLEDFFFQFAFYAWGFNGHPPLGVNATAEAEVAEAMAYCAFQWAPTLGGECYGVDILIHPNERTAVSMGTHPWG